MNNAILKYLYLIAQETKQRRIELPSIRGLAIKFNTNNNEVVKVFNFYKEQGIIIAEQGSKTYLIRKRFIDSFKNDTQIFFGKNIKRKVISQSIVKTPNGFEHKFIREFWKENKIASLSIDSLFSWDKMEGIDLDDGIDHFIKKANPDKKIVVKETTIIDIENFEEFKKLKQKYCVMLETKIFGEKQNVISHSFSLFPIAYYKNYHIEMLI